MKSFHLEQIITNYFQDNRELEIADAIFDFFIELSVIIEKPNQISDRANNDKFIDDYLEDLTDEQKKKIKATRDGMLIKLEHFKEPASVDELLKINFYYRKPSEQFLFDSKIKTFTDSDLNLKIDGYVKPLAGFASGWISESLPLQKGITCGQGKSRRIEFKIRKGSEIAGEYRWKVKNSDSSSQPRGEITIGKTKNDLESTQFISNSYVECYAIVDGICIARNKLNVKII